MESNRTTLAGLEGEKYETAFESYQIPDYILETVPEHYRSSITGAVWALDYGEIDEVWLTDSSRPYDLRAVYFTPEFWADNGRAEVA